MAQTKLRGNTMSQANKFKANYSDTNELMTALDNAGIESDQDFENETTTWSFEDDSQIIVSGPSIEVKD
jgi:hypothetical protein